MARTVSHFCIAIFILATAFHSTRSQDIPAVHVEPAWQVATHVEAVLYSCDHERSLSVSKSGEITVTDITGDTVLFYRRAKLLGFDRYTESFWVPGQYAIEAYSYRTGQRLDSIPCPTWPQSVGAQRDGSGLLLSDHSTLYAYDRTTMTWDTLISGLRMATAGFIHKELPVVAWTQYVSDTTIPWIKRPRQLHVLWTDSGIHDSVRTNADFIEDWSTHYAKHGDRITDLRTMQTITGVCTLDERFVLAPDTTLSSSYTLGPILLIELYTLDTLMSVRQGHGLSSSWGDFNPPSVVLSVGDTIFYFANEGTSYNRELYRWSIPDSQVSRTSVSLRTLLPANDPTLFFSSATLTSDCATNPAINVNGLVRISFPTLALDTLPRCPLGTSVGVVHQLAHDGSVLLGEKSTKQGFLNRGMKCIASGGRVEPTNMVGILVSERPLLLVRQQGASKYDWVFSHGDPVSRVDTVLDTGEHSFVLGDVVQTPGDTTVLCGRYELHSFDEVFGMCTVQPSVARDPFVDVEYTVGRDSIFGLTNTGIQLITRDANNKLVVRTYKTNLQMTYGNWRMTRITQSPNSFVLVGDRMLTGGSTYVVTLQDSSILYRSDTILSRVLMSKSTTYPVNPSSYHRSPDGTKILAARYLFVYDSVMNHINTLQWSRVLGDYVVAWCTDSLILTQTDTVLFLRDLQGRFVHRRDFESPIRACWMPDNSSRILVLTDDVLLSLSSDLSVLDSLPIQLFTDGKSHRIERVNSSDPGDFRALVRVAVPIDDSSAKASFVYAVLDLATHTIHPILPTSTRLNIECIGLKQHAYSLFVKEGNVHAICDLTTHKPIAVTQLAPHMFSGSSTLLNHEQLQWRRQLSPVNRRDLGVFACSLPETRVSVPSRGTLSEDRSREVRLTYDRVDSTHTLTFFTWHLSTSSLIDSAAITILYPAYFKYNVTVSENGDAWAFFGFKDHLVVRNTREHYSYSIRNAGEITSTLFNITGDTLFASSTMQGIRAFPLPSFDAVSVHPLQYYGSCEITCTPLNDFGVRMSGVREGVSTFIVDMNGREVQHTTTFQPSADGDDALIEVPAHASTLIMHVRSETCATYFVLFPDGTIGTPVK